MKHVTCRSFINSHFCHHSFVSHSLWPAPWWWFSSSQDELPQQWTQLTVDRYKQQNNIEADLHSTSHSRSPLQLITSATNVTTCEAWWEALQICNGFWKPLGMYFNELRKKRVTKMFYFSLIGLKGRWFLIALPIHVLTILRIILTSTYKNDPFIHGCGGGMVVGIGVSVFTYTLSWSIKYHLNHNIKLKL